eukprot:7545390-Lingulodinium_polyedra.AAC.1
MSARLLVATLVRYQEHRASAMASALLEFGSKLEEDLVATLRIKWDGAEQSTLMALFLAMELAWGALALLMVSARRAR